MKEASVQNVAHKIKGEHMIPTGPPRDPFMQQEALMAERKRVGFHPPLRAQEPEPVKPRGFFGKLFSFKK